MSPRAKGVRELVRRAALFPPKPRMPPLKQVKKQDPDTFKRFQKLLTDFADKAPLENLKLEEPELGPRAKWYRKEDPNHQVWYEMRRIGLGGNHVKIALAYTDRARNIDIPHNLVPPKGQKRVLVVRGGRVVSEHPHLISWLGTDPDPTAMQVVLTHDSMEIHYPGYDGRVHRRDPRTLEAPIGTTTNSRYMRLTGPFRVKYDPKKAPPLPKRERSFVRQDLGLGPVRWLLSGRSVNTIIKRPHRLLLMGYVRDEITREGKPGNLARALGKGEKAQLLVGTYLKHARQSEAKKNHPIIREILAPALANHPAGKVLKAHNHAGLEGVRIFAAIPDTGAANSYYRAYRRTMSKLPPSRLPKLTDALIRAYKKGQPPEEAVREFLPRPKH